MSNSQMEILPKATIGMAIRATSAGLECLGDPLANNARDALRNSVLETSRWRLEKAEEFKGDDRNRIAAKLLARLTETVSAVDRRLMINYAVNLDSEAIGSRLHETQSELLRNVGFQHYPAHAEGLVEEILAKADKLWAEHMDDDVA